MFTIGARTTFWRRALASRPMIRPYCFARSGENVEAIETGAGRAVAGRAVRMPAGPSDSLSGGTPSRGTPGM